MYLDISLLLCRLCTDSFHRFKTPWINPLLDFSDFSLRSWTLISNGNMSHQNTSSSFLPCLPWGSWAKGMNWVIIKSQHVANFPDICKKCNLYAALMMSASCCVQQGIGLKRLWWSQGKPFQMEAQWRKRDTIATKGVRYGSLGLCTGPSLSQLLVSSWSNLINLRGDLGRQGWWAGANIGQMSWADWGAITPSTSQPPTYQGTHSAFPSSMSCFSTWTAQSFNWLPVVLLQMIFSV